MGVTFFVINKLFLFLDRLKDFFREHKELLDLSNYSGTLLHKLNLFHDSVRKTEMFANHNMFFQLKGYHICRYIYISTFFKIRLIV